VLIVKGLLIAIIRKYQFSDILMICKYNIYIEFYSKYYELVALSDGYNSIG